jgi:aminoglycoside phosphotransferase (APT) family kinase protein
VQPHRVPEADARSFLVTRFGAIEALEVLEGGFWSSAFAFVHDGRALVARFGGHREWFEADRSAMAFSSRRLPVPDVLEVGDAPSGAYAISARHVGTRLEALAPEQSGSSGPLLASLLGALFEAPKDPRDAVCWSEPPPREERSWRSWLLGCLEGDANPAAASGAQRRALVGHREAEQVLRASGARIRSLSAACPERRDLVHGDLLHANVLVAEDASEPRAVFSWKCSVRGDFLYDVAWCTFWSPWYPGIAAADPWGGIQQEPSVLKDPGALTDAAVRHHCYELHVGATHLGWNAWIGDLAELGRVTDHLSAVLERGPLVVGGVADRAPS